MEKAIKNQNGQVRNLRKPDFLRAKNILCSEPDLIKRRLRRFGLNTVCEQARCPNIAECFSKHTATFLILGKICTRNCRFCAVHKGVALSPDIDEPEHIAQMAKGLKLRHIVITSVTRDDLADGGAEQFYKTVISVKRALPESSVEVLTPDFQGRIESVARVVEAGPSVYNHNLETVPRLYPEVRAGADYQRSLFILKWVSENAPGIKTKTGIMVGMGETRDEIIGLMKDSIDAGCKIMTIGQYLAPSRRHLPVRRYYEPEEFVELEQIGLEMGFKAVFAGPLVRSSYCAEEIFSREQAGSQILRR